MDEFNGKSTRYCTSLEKLKAKQIETIKAFHEISDKINPEPLGVSNILKNNSFALNLLNYVFYDTCKKYYEFMLKDTN